MIFTADTKQLKACFMPVSALETGSDLSAFLSFCQRKGLNAWATLPIHEPAWSPYRNSGFGILSTEHLWTDLQDIKINFALLNLSPQINKHQAKKAISLKSKKKSTPISHSIDPEAYTQDINDFIAKNEKWIAEAAFFSALSENFRTADWTKWPDGIKRRERAAMRGMGDLLSEQIAHHRQLETHKLLSFARLKTITTLSNIDLIGDFPFYIGWYTFTAWQNQDLFVFDHQEHYLDYVSGIPDHPQEPFGRQVWGHPLYDWQDQSKFEPIMKLFIARLEFLAQFYQTIRIDHANGFFQYGAVHNPRPQTFPNPSNTFIDQLLSGPGRPALQILLTKAQELGVNLFFEDVAADNTQLKFFMQKNNISGMRVLTHAYLEKLSAWDDSTANIIAQPIRSVFYTSTHDTPPLLSWLRKLSPYQLKQFQKINHGQITNSLNPQIITSNLIEYTLQNCPSQIIIIPIQDLLLEEKRLNVPGTPDQLNWNYKFIL